MLPNRARNLAFALLLAAGPALAQGPAPVPQVPAASPAPAAEDPAIRRLRDLLGPDVQAEYRAAEVLDSTTGRVRFDDLRLRDAGVELTAATLIVGGVRDDGVQELEIRDLRQVVENSFRASVRHVQLSGLTIPQPSSAVGLLTSGRIDRLTVEGVEVQSDGWLVGLGRLAIEEYGPGRPSGVRLGDLTARWTGDGPNAFSLARLAVSGLDIATQAAAFINGDVSRLGASQSTLLAEAFTLFQDDRVIVRAESLQGDSENDATLAGSSRLALRGLRLDGVPELQEILTTLGYQSLVMEIGMESRFEPQQQRMSIPGISIAATGFGRLTFGAELGGWDMHATRPEAAVMGLRLLGLTLGYSDEGLLPRLFRWQAGEQGVTEQELREEVIDTARSTLFGPVVGPLRKAVELFLRGQAQTLEIAMRPPQPIPLRELGDGPWPENAEAAMRAYGLTATAR